MMKAKLMATMVISLIVAMMYVTKSLSGGFF